MCINAVDVWKCVTLCLNSLMCQRSDYSEFPFFPYMGSSHMTFPRLSWFLLQEAFPDGISPKPLSLKGQKRVAEGFLLTSPRWEPCPAYLLLSIINDHQLGPHVLTGRDRSFPGGLNLGEHIAASLEEVPIPGTGTAQASWGAGAGFGLTSWEDRPLGSQAPNTSIKSGEPRARRLCSPVSSVSKKPMRKIPSLPCHFQTSSHGR